MPTHTVSAQHLNQLVNLAVRNRDHVVVDLPRRIDPVTALVIERATQLVLIVQQSVATLRDATRLLT